MVLHFIRSNLRWLAAGVLLTFASNFGQTFFISIFAKDIMANYALSFGEWGGLYAIGTLAAGFLMIWAGGATDKFRARKLASVFLLVLSAACFAMAMNTIYWLLPIIIFCLRFAGQSMLFHISAVSMARWFTQNRGKALAISNLGFSIGEACLPFLVVASLVFISWQSVWVIAGICALIYIPILGALLKTERQPSLISESTPDALGLFGKHWSRPDVLRNWLFWAILPCAVTPSMFVTTLFFHQIHLADAKGWGHANLVLLFPIYSAISVLAMIVYGWAIDKWQATRLLPFYQIPMGLAFLVFAYGHSLMSGMIALILMAMMQGGQSTILSAIWAEFYGTRHLGAIKALATALMVFGSAFGPWVSGHGIDAGIALHTQMPLFAIGVLLTCLMALAASKYATSASA